MRMRAVIGRSMKGRAHLHGTRLVASALLRGALALAALLPSAKPLEAQRPEGEARIRYTINDGWRFTLEGVEFAE